MQGVTKVVEEKEIVTGVVGETEVKEVVEGEILTQAEITQLTVQNYINHVARITGFMIDSRQARLLMEAAITMPLRTIADLSEEHGIPMEEIGVNLPYGKIYLATSEAVTGKPGEVKTKVLDDEGNPVLKSRIKMRFSKAVMEEAQYLTGWQQEGLAETVEERREKEENRIAEYEAANEAANEVTVADELSAILAKAASKFVKEVYGVDMEREVRDYEADIVEEGEVEESGEEVEETELEESIPKNQVVPDEVESEDEEVEEALEEAIEEELSELDEL